ncbi:uncharacterized protein LOC143237105 [Tachypleus tridentatus]|uniref:uncharacterized protein LOC143237105 n=1 Tax=Tachypleus tridentatus TaxID=6853 RepID=UPI003FCFFF3A
MVQEVEDTSLQSLFERNPELQQEGKTCLILEVLEPSSSENEENSKIKKTTKNSGGCRIEKNYNRNSSVQSDKDYKVWASSRQKLMSSHPKFSSGDISFSLNSREKKLGPDESRENVLMDTVLHSGKSQHHYDPSTLERNMLNVHLFSEDKTKCRLSVQDAMLNAHLSQETQVKTIDGGSSGFHEPDLIRETKTFQLFLVKTLGSLTLQRKKHFFKKSSCAPSQTYITEDTTTCKQSFLEDQNTGGVCAPSAERSNTSSQLLRLEELPSVLLPPRREPPPAPPTLQRSGRDVKDAIWSSAESGPLQESLEGASTCNTPLVSIVLQGQKHSKVSNTTSFSVHIKDCQIQQPFIVSSKPNSLSRIDSSPHAEDNENSSEFPLTKTFSTLIEVLLTPDSSTAGRQSPAPSEVSKTESALSPPIDVSKTEITKPHNLGKIEETVKREASCLTTGPMEVKTAATVDIIRLPTTDNGDDKITTGHESDSEVKSNFPELEHRKVNKANYGVSAEMTGKPWYDVSDEDDILSPGRYCLTVIGSSDDDREASSS